jgi:hypothetical protein
MINDLEKQNTVFKHYMMQIMHQLAFQHELCLSDKQLLENLEELLHIKKNETPKLPEELPEVWIYRDDSPKHPVFIEGKKAYIKCKSKKSNPYTINCKEHFIWERGWVSALEEAEFLYEG